MSAPSQLAKRLFEIESCGLKEDQGQWSLKTYESEVQSEQAQLYFWPTVDNFTGFVLYRVLPDSEVWIMNWACEKKGQGLGAQLFADFINFSRVQGFKKIGLEVRAGNEAALKIYKKFALKIVGQRPKYYSNSEDALVLLGNL